MNAKETVRMLTAQSAVWSQNKVAAEIGISPQNMSNKMRSGGDLRADLLAAYLDVLGYDLVAVPKRTRLPKGAVVIGGE